MFSIVVIAPRIHILAENTFYILSYLHLGIELLYLGLRAGTVLSPRIIWCQSYLVERREFETKFTLSLRETDIGPTVWEDYWICSTAYDLLARIDPIFF